jgi:hypothetical protein
VNFFAFSYRLMPSIVRRVNRRSIRKVILTIISQYFFEGGGDELDPILHLALFFSSALKKVAYPP